MPRPSEIQAEESATPRSPLRRSCRIVAVSSPAPSDVKPIKGRRLSAVSNDGRDEEVSVDEVKAASRTTRASSVTKENGPNPEPAKTRSRRNSATTESVIPEEKKPVARGRRSSVTIEETEVETVKPVRSRRSSVTKEETVIETTKPVRGRRPSITKEETEDKKPVKGRRSSVQEDREEESDKKVEELPPRGTRSRRSMSRDLTDDTEEVKQAKEVEITEKRATRSRRASVEAAEEKEDKKPAPRTPAKLKRRLSVTENATVLDPIDEKEQEHESPTKQELSVALTKRKPDQAQVKANLDLSVISESEEAEAIRIKSRLSKERESTDVSYEKKSENNEDSHKNSRDASKPERVSTPVLSVVLNKSFDEGRKTPDLIKSELHVLLNKSLEDGRRTPDSPARRSPRLIEKCKSGEKHVHMKCDCGESPIKTKKIDFDAKENKETSPKSASKENLETIKKQEDSLIVEITKEAIPENATDDVFLPGTIADKQITETKTYISEGSDGSFQLNLSKSKLQSTEDETDLNDSKTSENSDKENLSQNIDVSGKEINAKTTQLSDKKVLEDQADLGNKEMHLQNVTVARVSNVFRPKDIDYSYMEPMDVDVTMDTTKLEKSHLNSTKLQAECANESVDETFLLSLSVTHVETPTETDAPLKDIKSDENAEGSQLVEKETPSMKKEEEKMDTAVKIEDLARVSVNEQEQVTNTSPTKIRNEKRGQLETTIEQEQLNIETPTCKEILQDNSLKETVKAVIEEPVTEKNIAKEENHAETKSLAKLEKSLTQEDVNATKEDESTAKEDEDITKEDKNIAKEQTSPTKEKDPAKIDINPTKDDESPIKVDKTLMKEDTSPTKAKSLANEESVTKSTSNEKDDAEGKETEKEDAEGKESEKEDAEGKESEKEDAEGKESEKEDAEGKESEKEDAECKESEKEDEDDVFEEKGMSDDYEFQVPSEEEAAAEDDVDIDKNKSIVISKKSTNKVNLVSDTHKEEAQDKPEEIVTEEAILKETPSEEINEIIEEKSIDEQTEKIDIEVSREVSKDAKDPNCTEVEDKPENQDEENDINEMESSFKDVVNDDKEIEPLENNDIKNRTLIEIGQLKENGIKEAEKIKLDDANEQQEKKMKRRSADKISEEVTSSQSNKKSNRRSRGSLVASKEQEHVISPKMAAIKESKETKTRLSNDKSKTEKRFSLNEWFEEYVVKETDNAEANPKIKKKKRKTIELNESLFASDDTKDKSKSNISVEVIEDTVNLNVPLIQSNEENLNKSHKRNTINHDMSVELIEDAAELSVSQNKNEKNKHNASVEIIEDNNIKRLSLEEFANARLDEYIARKMDDFEEDENSSSCSDEESEGGNSFIDDMAEEGEEDTPSEDSNAIIDEGEAINSDSERSEDFDSDDDDSFICDEENIELLSGEEYDLGDAKKKKSRIINVEHRNEDVIKIDRKQTPKPKKKSRIIKVDDSSSDEDPNADSKTGKLLTEPLKEGGQRSRHSSINIIENIDVKEIRDAALSSRINQLVDSFCTTIPDKGGVSMNLSLEFAGNASSDGKTTTQRASKDNDRNSLTSTKPNNHKRKSISNEEVPSKQARMSVSLIDDSNTRKRKQKRSLSKSMDDIEGETKKLKKKKNKSKKSKQEDNVQQNPSISSEDLRKHTFGLMSQLLNDVKNRPKRLIKPSTKKLEDLNSSWMVENDVQVKPSTTIVSKEEMEDFKKNKCHPKDFRQQMLHDPSRVKRIETKQLLRKKGAYY